jgi:hypothetical protein
MKNCLPFIFAGFAIFTASCDSIIDEPPDYQVLRESRPVGSAKEMAVMLRYDVGMLQISKSSGADLFSFDLEYDRRRTSPSLDFEAGDRAELRLEIETRHSLPAGRRDSDLSLRLSDKVPLDLDIRTGVSESHLDMTGLLVRRMRLRGGVGKTDVSFDEQMSEPVKSVEVESGVGELIIRGLGNARVERLQLTGGVGRTELDYTGDLGTTHSESTIKVGVGQIRLLLPRDANIEIRADGSFLSNINAPSFERNGRTYTHRGASDGSKINILVESGVGGVTVELI